MSQKKISAVVPVYNVEKYLPECLDSLVSQTLRDIQIILVDDGSSDASGGICDDYAAKDGRIRVIHKINGGVSAARNDGMDAADGEYVLFCDSDDWMEPDAFEKLYQAGRECGADIVIGDVYQSENGQEKLARFYKERFVTEDREFIEGMIQANFYRTYCPMPPKEGPAFGYYGGPWNKAVRLSMLRDGNIRFDARVKGIYDDILYTAHILASAQRIAYIAEPVYHYRIIPSSITRTYKPNALEINDAIFSCWREFIEKYGSRGQFEKPFYANVVRRLMETLPIYFFSEKNSRPLPEKLKELRRTLAREPYRTAARNAELGKLSSYHRAQLRMMRLRSAVAVWLVFCAKYTVKKAIRQSGRARARLSS